jgi:surface antigen
MNQQSTTPASLKRAVTSSVLVAGAVMMVLAAPMAAYADKYDDQIKALQGEIDGYQSQAGSLQAQADTLQNKVNSLNAQKAAIQAQIDLNQAKYDQLTQQIADNEAKLQKQQGLLGDTLAQLYADSDTSSVELLASSKSIGDFIDKQEYRSSVRNQVLGAIKSIKDLKIQLAQQKVDTEHVLADQNGQRQQLAAQEAEQANLLAQTQGQEAAYQQIIGDKNSQVSGLRAQQAAANRKLSGGATVTAGDPSRGGYPNSWYNAPQDSLIDTWGMYNRECVSYTAWKVNQAGKYMPYWGGSGNANEWPGNARAANIPTGSEPRVHSVAISMAGGFGHAMWVESVSGSMIHVSQMNYDLAGHYSEMTIDGSGLIYIYF